MVALWLIAARTKNSYRTGEAQLSACAIASRRCVGANGLRRNLRQPSSAARRSSVASQDPLIRIDRKVQAARRQVAQELRSRNIAEIDVDHQTCGGRRRRRPDEFLGRRIEFSAVSA